MRQVSVLALLVAMLCVGCGEEEPVVSTVPTYPVRGTVLWQGQPLADAEIAFVPETSTGAPPARAVSAADGSFVLSTYKQQDGAPAGAYRVVVVRYEKVADLKREDRDEAPNTLPEVYRFDGTTPLRVRVEASENVLPPLALEP